jgi:hypothetical protein
MRWRPTLIDVLVWWCGAIVVFCLLAPSVLQSRSSFWSNGYAMVVALVIVAILVLIATGVTALALRGWFRDRWDSFVTEQERRRVAVKPLQSESAKQAAAPDPARDNGFGSS